MAHLLCAAAACIVSWDLAAPLKNRPAIFYGAAAALCAAQLAASLLAQGHMASRALAAFVGNGLLSFYLFAVVMFTGCFKPGSRIRKRLMQVREPLANTASILAIGHILFVGIERGSGSKLGTPFAVNCAILIIFLTVLTATSLPWIRARMNLAVWKKIHLLAYAFFLTACIHGAWAASATGEFALSLLYGTIGAFYAAIRLTAWHRLRRHSKMH